MVAVISMAALCSEPDPTRAESVEANQAIERDKAWFDGDGVTLGLAYTADFFYNLRGGLNTSDADQYRAILELSLELDTEAAGLWHDGTVFVSVLENHGRDITERHVGDLQAVNNADAPNRARLYEFWYEHVLWDGALRIKLGKMDANEEFAAPDYGGEFVHSSSGFSPTIPFPTWPDPALGVMLSAEPVEWLYLRAAVYDAEATGTRCGFDTAFHRPDMSITMFELGLRPRLTLFGQSDMPGAYRIGGFYHSGEWDRLPRDADDEEPDVHVGNAGLYLVFDQALYREGSRGVDDGQGLGAFLQFGWAPSDHNEITQHYGGGLLYTGLIPNRDTDVTGFAVHHVNLSRYVQALEDRHSETAVEFFHKFIVTDAISVKPDLHYIVNPGGSGRDAVVAGVRIEIGI
ncbi:MAG: carbohydrate porin [Phycisphaerae bacterium]|jgi:porin